MRHSAGATIAGAGSHGGSGAWASRRTTPCLDSAMLRAYPRMSLPAQLLRSWRASLGPPACILARQSALRQPLTLLDAQLASCARSALWRTHMQRRAGPKLVRCDSSSCGRSGTQHRSSRHHSHQRGRPLLEPRLAQASCRCHGF